VRSTVRFQVVKAAAAAARARRPKQLSQGRPGQRGRERAVAFTARRTVAAIEICHEFSVPGQRALARTVLSLSEY
jgi:hypothetical protein